MVAMALLAGCGATGTKTSNDTLSSGTGSTTSSTDNAPGAGIFGRVVTSDSQPAAGATVQLVASDGTALSDPVTCDSNGDFSIPEPAGGVPDGAEIKVTPQNQPPAEAPVSLPSGSGGQLNLQLQADGSLQVQVILARPATAVVLGGTGGGGGGGGHWSTGSDPHAPALVAFTNGVSDPFSLSFQGPFSPGSNDLALIWSQPGGAWMVQRLATAQAAAPSLDLGSAAATDNGVLLQVAAMAAPLGSLANVTTFTNPVSLPFVVRVSVPPVQIVPVVTRTGRLATGQILPNAVLVGDGANGTLSLTAGDLATLGVSAGARVTLSNGQQSASVNVVAGNDAELALATAHVGPDVAAALGLNLSRVFAGYTLTVSTTARRR